MTASSAALDWTEQIKLSGITGYPSHPLAVINGKTVSPGERITLKLKKRSADITCLEIQERSVIVEVAGITGRCELNYGGLIIPEQPKPEPVAVEPSQSQKVSPQPIAVSPLQFFQLKPAPKESGIGISAFVIGLVAFIVGLVFGAAIATGITRGTHHQNIGEAMVAETIANGFKRPHLLLNNVTLPTAEGTTQIDHILVTDTGIFVIETKHYQGWIFGDPKESQWTQVIYRKKSRFPNPIRQNYGHIKAVQALFNMPEEQFHSLVVFTGDAELKTDFGLGVFRLPNLLPFLTSDRPVIFDERKMTYIVGRIEMSRKRRSLETDEYHLNHIRSKIAGRSVR